MVSGSFYLFLLSLVCSSGVLSSTEDCFYLTLTLVENEDTGGSGSGGSDDLGLGNLFGSGVAPAASNTSDSTSTQCEFKSSEVPVSCSCGEDLEKSRRDHEQELNATCELFDELKNPASNFSFCENSLRTLISSSLGYRIEKLYVNCSNDTGVFNSSSLQEKLSKMEQQLGLFRRVLDRTIAGLLVKSDRDKCFCFDRYKKWLCTISLPFFTEKNSTCSNATTTWLADSDIELVQQRPCIQVCHDTLQSCPYYTPARYQPQRGANFTPTSDEAAEVIYGGYPAFDCPRKEYIQQLQESTYIFNCDDKGQRIGCFNEDSAWSHDGSRTVLTISVLLVVLLSRVISC